MEKKIKEEIKKICIVALPLFGVFLIILDYDAGLCMMDVGLWTCQINILVSMLLGYIAACGVAASMMLACRWWGNGR